MFELLKLYPNQTGFFVGAAIGLGTYIVSTSLCIFANGCSEGNPFFPLATFLGSCVVGMYCSWLTEGKLKYLVGFSVTLLMLFAALASGMRELFDNLLQGESVLSHSAFYGFVTLVFAFAISTFNNSQSSD